MTLKPQDWTGGMSVHVFQVKARARGLYYSCTLGLSTYVDLRTGRADGGSTFGQHQ